MEKNKSDDWLGLGTLIFKDLGEGSAKPEAPKSLDAFKPTDLKKELNPYFQNGGSGLPEAVNDGTSALGYEFGDSGSSWRMMKLKRLFEEHRNSEVSIEELAIIRYGNMERFQAAMKERHYLDTSKPNLHKKPQFKKNIGGVAIRSHIKPIHNRSRGRPRISHNMNSLSRANKFSTRTEQDHKNSLKSSVSETQSIILGNNPNLKATSTALTNQHTISSSKASTETHSLEKQLAELKSQMLKSKVMAPQEFPKYLKQYELIKTQLESSKTI